MIQISRTLSLSRKIEMNEKTTNNKQAWSNLFTSSDCYVTNHPTISNKFLLRNLHLTFQSFYFSRHEPRFEDVRDHYYTNSKTGRPRRLATTGEEKKE